MSERTIRAVPQERVRSALDQEPTASLLVTEAGYAARIARHRALPDGSTDEAIAAVCVAGAGTITAGGRSHAVGPGQAFVIPPGVPHLCHSDDRAPWTLWWLHAAGTLVPSLLAGADVRVVVLDDPYRCVSAVQEALRVLVDVESPESLAVASAQGWVLLAGLAAPVRRSSDPSRIAREHIDRNLGTSMRVNDLARLVNLSESRFTALFRASTGMGVTAYVKQQRMARARELLSTGSRRVAEIAALVGYPDPFYFARQFHAVHGVSPTGYRRQRVTRPDGDELRTSVPT
ncbi:AraC family transcriptional regulator [Lentzea sp. JNUCC 0626]|uniref:AraC family transcriptional regulator n=1 Tax=Lentzea sp. JNUCC 0626 TaxID=3367513 RepID=UPI003748FE1E